MFAELGKPPYVERLVELHDEARGAGAVTAIDESGLSPPWGVADP